ncbi:beta-1,4-N-acetylgalactosaminyltransferase 3 isoform X2 [Tachysurus fulvidraco]|uniref:beta-1,4-N-acetylgalactosaminyltransferase 3 isoform X2 n=1 Tax=Tachysurus fulvidraco TaxID=1234273 RepID=UPI001FEF322D|nr:beta-1,4-N-acetylgalactosaminyltransferase 3 isoform X2 [Tachysurus fulvidraco]
MELRWEHFRLFFSIRRLHLFRVVFLSLVVMIVFTCLSVFNSNSKTTSKHLEFWERQKQAEERQPLWKPEFLGEANMHIFEDWCGGSVHHLRTNLLYPLYPHIRTTIHRLAVSAGWKNYGLRIFGYLQPRYSGEYIFAVASDNNAEFWLSSDDSTERLNLIAYLGKKGNEWAAPGEYEKFASQISQPVLLSRKMWYFFEVLYKQGDGTDHLEVAWRPNDEESTFEVITAEYLSLYIDESNILMADNNHVPQTKASQRLSPDHIFKPAKKQVDMIKADPRDFMYKTPLLHEFYLEKVFPVCEYNPLHMFDNDTIERYDGINHVYYSSVYPNDYTRLAHEGMDREICFYQKDETYDKERGFGQYIKIENIAEDEEKVDESEKQKINEPKWKQFFRVNVSDFHAKQGADVVNTCNRAGNIIMPKKEVMPVVEAFMTQLHKANTSRDLVLKRVLNVEKKTDDAIGSRFLLELELENPQGDIILLSKYFFATKSKNKWKNPERPSLCNPKGFSWNPDAKVHVILAVKNQGRWVIHFLKEMEKVYEATGDKNFNIILIDYNSTDIDVEKELKNSNLPRSPGLQAGIDLVDDENSILFLCDLHLHFPTTIIDSLRKHCVQGKMVFAPIVMRLECGATIHAPAGFWETMGYGLIGIYHSDIIRIGGMNTKEFTDKWGGEDWELLDRILLNKLEVERLNIRNFLHFYHSKHGMWNRQ